jgi:hypothetical protein
MTDLPEPATAAIAIGEPVLRPNSYQTRGTGQLGPVDSRPSPSSPPINEAFRSRHPRGCSILVIPARWAV